MHRQPESNVLFLLPEEDVRLDGFIAVLRSLSGMAVIRLARVPEDFESFNAVVTMDLEATDPAVGRLEGFVRNGGGWLAFMTHDRLSLPKVFGATLDPAKPLCELRVLFKEREHPLGRRLPDAYYVDGPLIPITITDPNTDILLYADWHYTHQWVVVTRPSGRGRMALTTLTDFRSPALRQIFFRLIGVLSGRPEDHRALDVGILGYAPSVGKLHGLGAAHTDGLALKAACDLDPARREQAIHDFPDITCYESAEAMADAADVDLVIIATPPDTHARLAIDMMAAGKHVVCEKPLALTRKEADAMAEAAERHRRHLSCHQNRRWDPDYLAVRRALDDKRIGDLFYMETFVGHHHHPCGYWHSHAAVSGGTAYDWGGHYLDWIVSLLTDRVTGVIGTRHKRIWHDVTNADQERVQIRFAGGQEAEFLHSDIAAARKPKWYLLGTRGAIVGHWREVAAYGIDPVHYFERTDIPATEMPPDLTAYCREPSGRVTSRKLDVPPREPFAFHRNLADHLLTGEALAAPLADSMKVVAILEAATRSAENGGRLEEIDV